MSGADLIHPWERLPPGTRDRRPLPIEAPGERLVPGDLSTVLPAPTRGSGDSTLEMIVIACPMCGSDLRVAREGRAGLASRVRRRVMEHARTAHVLGLRDLSLLADKATLELVDRQADDAKSAEAGTVALACPECPWVTIVSLDIGRGSPYRRARQQMRQHLSNRHQINGRAASVLSDQVASELAVYLNL